MRHSDLLDFGLVRSGLFTCIALSSLSCQGTKAPPTAPPPANMCLIAPPQQLTELWYNTAEQEETKAAKGNYGPVEVGGSFANQARQLRSGSSQAYVQEVPTKLVTCHMILQSMSCIFGASDANAAGALDIAYRLQRQAEVVCPTVHQDLSAIALSIADLDMHRLAVKQVLTRGRWLWEYARGGWETTGTFNEEPDETLKFMAQTRYCNSAAETCNDGAQPDATWSAENVFLGQNGEVSFDACISVERESTQKARLHSGKASVQLSLRPGGQLEGVWRGIGACDQNGKSNEASGPLSGMRFYQKDGL